MTSRTYLPPPMASHAEEPGLRAAEASGALDMESLQHELAQMRNSADLSRMTGDEMIRECLKTMRGIALSQSAMITEIKSIKSQVAMLQSIITDPARRTAVSGHPHRPQLRSEPPSAGSPGLGSAELTDDGLSIVSSVARVQSVSDVSDTVITNENEYKKKFFGMTVDPYVWMIWGISQDIKEIMERRHGCTTLGMPAGKHTTVRSIISEVAKCLSLQLPTRQSTCFNTCVTVLRITAKDAPPPIDASTIASLSTHPSGSEAVSVLRLLFSGLRQVNELFDEPMRSMFAVFQEHVVTPQSEYDVSWDLLKETIEDGRHRSVVEVPFRMIKVYVHSRVVQRLGIQEAIDAVHQDTGTSTLGSMAGQWNTASMRGARRSTASRASSIAPSDSASQIGAYESRGRRTIRQGVRVRPLPP